MTDSALERALRFGDNEAMVTLLQPLSSQGVASPEQELLLGIKLMMPPVADYGASLSVLAQWRHSEFSFEAAVWAAYCDYALSPSSIRSFEAVLHRENSSAIALHMLCMIARFNRDEKTAIKLNRQSRSINKFPANLIVALQLEVDLPKNDKRMLWREADRLIVHRSVEKVPTCTTIRDELNLYWSNLILEDRITTSLWERYVNDYSDL